MTVKLTERRRDVLMHLGSRGLSFNQICDRVDRHPSSVRSLLDRMQKAGLIRNMGRSSVYFATEVGRSALSPEAPASSKEEGE